MIRPCGQRREEGYFMVWESSIHEYGNEVENQAEAYDSKGKNTSVVVGGKKKRENRNWHGVVRLARVFSERYLYVKRGEEIWVKGKGWKTEDLKRFEVIIMKVGNRRAIDRNTDLLGRPRDPAEYLCLTLRWYQSCTGGTASAHSLMLPQSSGLLGCRCWECR